jgi:PleD family two-component response regulator
VTTPPGAPTPTILVADDDAFNLRLLAELCESAGYRVITASDGGQVLDLVARERPDLMILDVMMPVHDGFEVMQILRGDPELAGIPVVLVTASGDVETRSRGIDLGAEDYITKPYRVFEIQQRIRNALRVRAAERAAAQASDRARDAETVDGLTRAGTSQQLTISLEYEHTRAARYGHPLTLMVVRLANHEEIVGAAGQEAGDGALVQLVQGLRTCIRAIDH